jgi:hypothetical protein
MPDTFSVQSGMKKGDTISPFNFQLFMQLYSESTLNPGYIEPDLDSKILNIVDNINLMS